jgi:hypothetical protein
VLACAQGNYVLRKCTWFGDTDTVLVDVLVKVQVISGYMDISATQER